MASSIKALRPDVKVLGAEPETAAPASLSFAKGSAQVYTEWKSSFVDGAGGQSMFPRMWERMKDIVDGSIVVTLDETRNAMRIMAEKARIISEGAGALPLAAALSGKAGEGPIVAVVSGGRPELKQRPTHKFLPALHAAGVDDIVWVVSDRDAPRYESDGHEIVTYSRDWAEEYAAGHWLLTGTKTAVPAATRADLILVPAATASGPAVFLVAPDDPGDVLVQPQRLVDGDLAGRLELTRLELPGDRVLGSPQAGAEIIDWLMARGTVGQCALQFGVLARALELTSEHAKSRVQFGRPIGAFQAVAQRLADAFIDVEAVRLTMWQAAWRLATGLPCETEIATAKFWAADAGHRVAHTAVHIHGGMGIDTDHPTHRYFVAAKRTEFELGGATTQLRRIGAALARAQ